ncbi:MAG TPA: hypothetical protein VMB77_05080 [Syntrophales bacterium]|nr:hypothetical protein [Syntrophales bacterium]
MKTTRIAILTLLIPLLVLTALSDVVDQDGFALQGPPVITSLDEVSPQYDRHQPSPVIHSCPQSEQTDRPVWAPLRNFRTSATPSCPALSFLLRAPPLC